MRNYVAAPVLLGAAFAVLYGVIGVLATVFNAFGWIDEMRFHIMGVHFEGFGLLVVSVGLIVLAVVGMLYLTRGTQQSA